MKNDQEDRFSTSYQGVSADERRFTTIMLDTLKVSGVQQADGTVPLQARIDQVTADSDLAEVCATERHPLYVATSRAREYLFVSGVEPVSEFLADLGT